MWRKSQPFSVLQRTILRSPENGFQFQQPKKCNAYIYHYIYMRCTSRAAEIENCSPENEERFSGERRTVLRRTENSSQFQQPEKCNTYIYRIVYLVFQIIHFSIVTPSRLFLHIYTIICHNEPMKWIKDN